MCMIDRREDELEGWLVGGMIVAEIGWSGWILGVAGWYCSSHVFIVVREEGWFAIVDCRYTGKVDVMCCGVLTMGAILPVWSWLFTPPSCWIAVVVCG